MTKEKILVLYKGLNSVGNLIGVKFAYAVSKNLNLLMPEVNALNKAGESYNNARLELCKQYSKKDENNEPIILNNEYQLADKKAFDEAAIKLKEIPEYRDYLQLLEESTELNLFKVKLDDVPKNISVYQMYSIDLIVEE